MTLKPQKARFYLLVYPGRFDSNKFWKSEWQSHLADINLPLTPDMYVLMLFKMYSH